MSEENPVRRRFDLLVAEIKIVLNEPTWREKLAPSEMTLNEPVLDTSEMSGLRTLMHEVTEEIGPTFQKEVDQFIAFLGKPTTQDNIEELVTHRANRLANHMVSVWFGLIRCTFEKDEHISVGEISCLPIVEDMNEYCRIWYSVAMQYNFAAEDLSALLREALTRLQNRGDDFSAIVFVPSA